ncbi:MULTISPECIES: sigma-70 family RNA polymerase sigma factor [Bacteria]|uniref:sigma-70 family RNA polymerase sigma factor n=1 Tax=Bacteria TaxID=2 RepID=UPI003C7DE1C7
MNERSVFRAPLDEDAAREAEALRELFTRHYAAVLRHVIARTRNRDDADDIAQEVFLRAWQHKHILNDDPSMVRAWMFTVARNLVIDQARSARNRHEVKNEPAPERLAPDDVEKVHTRILVRDLLRTLGDRQREAVVHSFFAERSTTELARELGIAEGTAKSRVHYGIRALRATALRHGISR